jgi:hypothetical protein
LATRVTRVMVALGARIVQKSMVQKSTVHKVWYTKYGTQSMVSRWCTGDCSLRRV